MALALAAWSATTFTCNADTNTYIASPSFSPGAGDIVVVIGFLDSNPAGSQVTETTPTNTGTALSWALLARENTFTGSLLAGSMFAYWAYNVNAQTGITVSATGGFSGYLKCVAVIGFAGASTTQTGFAHQATAYTAAATTPTLASMTTTQAGSWCWMAGFDWTNYRATVAAAAGQSAQIATQNPNSAGDTIIVTKENPQPAGSRSSGTSVTMSLTGSTASDQWHLIGWEVLPGAGGTDFTAHPDSADGAGTAYAASPQTGLSAGPLYAGTAAGVSGVWFNESNATGSTQGTYASWTDSGSGTSAVLELASFNAQSSVPGGSTVGNVQCTVRHGETPASAIASVTAQAYSGATPVGSPQALTAADAVHDDTVTFTGLAYADLADLRVRVTVTRN